VNRTLVLGLGNILLRDEGVGVRVVEELQGRYDFPDEVVVLDGGTLGLDLLPYVEAADRLLVIDALDLGAKPGTVARLRDEEIPAFLSPKVSPHQMGLVDLLAAAHLSGALPEELVLWGVQPEAMNVGLDLSPTITAQVETLVANVLTELEQWGIVPTRSVRQEKST
jgi:hydrogenase maturation protease